jgi:hypothetical protein
VAWIGSVLGGIAFVIVFALINGGYVYKTTCPLASGGSESSWTYAINDIIPYTRSTNAPCHGHTGTRLALSGLGIWPLGHKSTTHELTAEDQQAAESLRVATSAITAEYAFERQTSDRLRAESNNFQAMTPKVRTEFANYINTAAANYEKIKANLDKPTAATDQQLIDTRKALSEWLGYIVGVNSLFQTSSSIEDWQAKTKQYLPKLRDSASRLRYLSVAVQTRFPQVKEWGFLPAK